jgi:large subunit ribosomal protein L4
MVKLAFPSKVFDVAIPNHELLKLAYEAYLANGRSAHATTKRRGEVRGGGKKPWRQKGTGRARFGSTRNPIWRGGGVAFGPHGDENYSIKLNTNSKRAAVRQALTLTYRAGKIRVSDIKTTGKTAEIVAFLRDSRLKRRVLIVVDEKTPEIIRATNNIPEVVLTKAQYLNVYHILNADHIVMSTKSIAVLENWLTKGDK